MPPKFNFDLQGEPSFAKGSQAWVPHAQEGWACGEVSQILPDGKFVVELENGEEHITSKAMAMPVNPPEYDCVADMTMLMHLNEPGILENLRKRYEFLDIYTFTGHLLIAVNPYQPLRIFTEELIEKYNNSEIGTLPPHVYSLADKSFRLLKQEKESQSLIISGESGAGKTETTKIALRYFAAVGGTAQQDGVGELENKLLETNTLFEAFGNAKTVRNDNSSRFGKFIMIQFDNCGRISGAKITSYLLEKSRLVFQQPDERNYHIFYQLFAGSSKTELEMLGLTQPEEFNYLNQSGCIRLDTVSDASEYRSTRRAMDLIGLEQREQKDIVKILASLLHFGNIEFDERDESSYVLNAAPLDMASSILGISPDTVTNSFCSKRIRAGLEYVEKKRNAEEASYSRDALAKNIYRRMFDWMIERVNTCLGQGTDKLFIGVLDIFGFEIFEENSFEQLCINYANEKLQKHFNDHVFRLEQDEYKREKISWSYIEFADNQDVLELIDKKSSGIMAFLDEECVFPKASDRTLTEKLHSNLKSHARFGPVSKHARHLDPNFSFLIHHYAGDVCYDTTGWLDKNNDTLHADFVALMQSSHNDLIRLLFPKEAPVPKTAGSRRPSGLLRRRSSATADAGGLQFVSVCSQFKDQLAELMDTLNSTTPHFIRCIKPNEMKRPNIFESKSVLHQLRCQGVLEAVRITHAGFPTRITFDKFFDRYKIIEPDIRNKKFKTARDACEALIDRLPLDKDQCQIGKTKLFFRLGKLAAIDDLKNRKLHHYAAEIQRHARGRKQRLFYRKMKAASVRMQSLVRMFLNVRRYQRIKQRHYAAINIQSHGRMLVCRSKYQNKRRMAIRIQSAARRMIAVNFYRWLIKQQHTAIVLQKNARMFLAKRRYQRWTRGLIRLQAVYRGYSTRMKTAGNLPFLTRLQARRVSRIMQPVHGELQQGHRLWLEKSKEKIEKEKSAKEMAYKAAEAELRNRVEAETSRAKDAENDVQALKESLDVLRATLDNERKTNLKLESELSERGKALEDLQQTHEAARKEIESLKESVETLKKSEEDMKAIMAINPNLRLPDIDVKGLFGKYLGRSPAAPADPTLDTSLVSEEGDHYEPFTPRSPPTSPGRGLMLRCTSCLRRVPEMELEAHSKTCSIRGHSDMKVSLANRSLKEVALVLQQKETELVMTTPREASAVDLRVANELAKEIRALRGIAECAWILNRSEGEKLRSQLLSLRQRLDYLPKKHLGNVEEEMALGKTLKKLISHKIDAFYQPRLQHRESFAPREHMDNNAHFPQPQQQRQQHEHHDQRDPPQSNPEPSQQTSHPAPDPRSRPQPTSSNQPSYGGHKPSLPTLHLSPIMKARGPVNNAMTSATPSPAPSHVSTPQSVQSLPPSQRVGRASSIGSPPVDMSATNAVRERMRKRREEKERLRAGKV